MAEEPELNAENIQGNILVGFRRTQQFLVGFSGATSTSMRSALEVISPDVTSLPDVLRHKDERKLAFVENRKRPTRKDLWLNFALGKGATDVLGLQDLNADELAFAAGMIPSRTGDSTQVSLDDGSLNPACPNNWIVGGPKHPLDLLLILAADDSIAQRAQPLVAQIEACGLKQIYAEEAHLLPGDVEHFGFRDGISQPGILGTIEVDGTKRYLTARYGVPGGNGVEFGKPGQPLQPASQFIFDETTPQFANSAYLVFRRLTQDVQKFLNTTDQLSSIIASPTEPTLDGEALRARIIGRWPSGEPLMRTSAPPHDAESVFALNQFEFGVDTPALVLTNGARVAGCSGDPQVQHGGRCPVWAHIRKVNPRDLQTDKGGPDDTRGFQMLRRGIPFGPLYDRSDPTNPINSKERGLLFLAYQRSISNQFEVLNSDWMNSSSNPSPYGFDLLVGQHLSATGANGSRDADYFSSTTGQTQRFAVPSQWIFPTGGAYLFAPSLRLTKQLATM